MFVSKNKFWSIAVAEADAMNLLPIKKRRLFYDAILIDVLYAAKAINIRLKFVIIFFLFFFLYL